MKAGYGPASATPLESDKWLPMQRKRRRSHDIGINSNRNGLRSSPALSVARAILKRLAVCTVLQTFGIGHGGRSDVKRHVETEGQRNRVVEAKQTCRQVRLSEMRYPPRANDYTRWKTGEGGSLLVQVCAFIHYVILLHTYIELPIGPYSIHILVFFIVNLKWSILKMYIQKWCHRDKRGHRIAQIAAFAI